mmetsp:Transcript_92884/g.160942  ORF Transcript_92884/g.160942 Transcript_92884/m.160942 type:complete len:89 (+) Transcript_92884:43-309(+)
MEMSLESTTVPGPAHSFVDGSDDDEQVTTLQGNQKKHQNPQVVGADFLSTPTCSGKSKADCAKEHMCFWEEGSNMCKPSNPLSSCNVM